MFDLAFSFAGENRLFVESIKDELKKTGVKIFYDNDYKIDLWGSDLTEELPKKYHDSRYVALFLDDNYLNKMWTFFERQIIIEKYLKNRGANYILPIMLNSFDKPIPGISGLVGFMRINTLTDKDILVQALHDKVKIK